MTWKRGIVTNCFIPPNRVKEPLEVLDVKIFQRSFAQILIDLKLLECMYQLNYSSHQKFKCNPPSPNRSGLFANFW